MSFLEPDYDDAWSALRSMQQSVIFNDDDLLIGASRSNDWVGELIIYPSSPDDDFRDTSWRDQGDGEENPSHGGDDGRGDDSTLAGFQLISRALAFADSKLGDVSGQVTSHLKTVLSQLYYQAHVNQWTIDGPFGSKLSNLELAGALEKMEFHKGPHPEKLDSLGAADWRQDGSGKVDIYFSADDQKYSGYAKTSMNGFFYVILHELGHSMPDAWDMMSARLKDGSWSTEDATWAEELAHEYGKVLGGLIGLPYKD
jgi:hypothetical protein